MSKSLSVGESLLRARIMRQIDQKELFSKHAWKHPQGSFFRKLKATYFITAVYSFLVFILNELVFFMLYGSGFDMTNEQVAFFSKNHWVVHGAFLLAVITFIIMCLKKTKLACGLQLVVGALIIFQIFQVFHGLYANQGLLGGLYLFALIPFLCAIGMLAIYRGYSHRVNKRVEKEIQMLYQQYDREDHLMNSKEWDSILEKHENELLNL